MFQTQNKQHYRNPHDNPHFTHQSIYIYIYTHIYRYIHIHTCAYTYMYAHVYIYIYIYTYTFIYVCMYIHIYVYTLILIIVVIIIYIIVIITRYIILWHTIIQYSKTVYTSRCARVVLAQGPCQSSLCRSNVDG